MAQTYTVILVPQDLIPQVVGELLEYAVNPDHVQVVYGESGREVHVHPEVADAWYNARQLMEHKQEAKETAAADAPLSATPPNIAATAAAAVAKKKTTSASRNSEES